MSRRDELQQKIDDLQAELLALPADPPKAEPAFLRLDDYATRVSMSTRQLRRLIDDGLPCSRPRPRTIRIPVQAADAWMQMKERSARVAATKGTST